MGRSRHIEVERQLEKFRKFCEIYWDFVPVDDTYDSWSRLLPIQLHDPGMESFYEAFMVLRGLAQYLSAHLQSYPATFESVWFAHGPFYRSQLYRQQKHKRKLEAKRARREYGHHDLAGRESIEIHSSGRETGS